MAVVPDNRDPHLMVARPAEDFWERVREWQARGWAIGLHGYHHTYVNREPGILRLNPRSEFAGLSYPEQYRKLSGGLEIFAREGVRADAWIAPAHSFDGVTILALKALGLPIISDGMAFFPYVDPVGVTWVPQQFAGMRSLPWGVWTFCYHINGIPPAGLAAFKRSLLRLHPRMISLPEAVARANRRIGAADRLVGLIRQLVTRARRMNRGR
jgi:predicted deacetylase